MIITEKKLRNMIRNMFSKKHVMSDERSDFDASESHEEKAARMVFFHGLRNGYITPTMYNHKKMRAHLGDVYPEIYSDGAGKEPYYSKFLDHFYPLVDELQEQ